VVPDQARRFKVHPDIAVILLVSAGGPRRLDGFRQGRTLRRALAETALSAAALLAAIAAFALLRHVLPGSP
jgi:hypothetical protein